MRKYIEKNEFLKSYNNLIIPYITRRRTDGYFDGYGGGNIFYSLFKSDKPRGSVVLVHGYTESIEKYRELIYYFLKDGLNVYTYDQRGHGKSFREVEDVTLVHVNDFSEYVFDLEYFVEDIIPKNNLPLYLYAHSMGGAVATLYLEKGNTDIKKVILNAPMISHRRPNLPHWLMLPIVSIFAAFASKKRIFTMKPYPGKEEFEDYSGTSEERFYAYEEFKRKNKTYAGWAPTNAWARESFKVPSKILKKKAVEKIDVPILVYSAENDTVVKNSYHVKFVKRLKYGMYKIIRKAKHEIFNSTDDVLFPYLDDVLAFFDVEKRD